MTRTFRLAVPRRSGTWIAIAAAVPLGIALPILSTSIQSAVAGEPAPDSALRGVAAQMQALVETSPAWRLALLLGVLPALCEEFVYRGFVLSGLGGAWTSPRGRVAAVLVTAGFFALSHVFPEKWATTFAMGVILGWLALRTGSIFPSIVAHALHNAATVVASKHAKSEWAQWLYGGESGPGAPRIAVAAVATALLVVAVHLATRPRPDATTRGT